MSERYNIAYDNKYYFTSKTKLLMTKLQIIFLLNNIAEMEMTILIEHYY